MNAKKDYQDDLSRALAPLLSDAFETAIGNLVRDGKFSIPKQAEKPKEQSDEQWWTIDQFCAYAHVSRPTYHSFVHRGFIRPRKCGQRTLICVSEVKEQMDHGEFGKYVRIIKKQ